jgi:uncharacterized protein (TIGR02145 family)
MKTFNLSILLIIAILKVHAQNYLVGFAGTGASINVDSVKVENLSQCTSLAVAGNDLLNLTATLGTQEPGIPHAGHVNIYPNPSSGSCSVEFEATPGNKVCIGLNDISGKTVLQYRAFMKERQYTIHLNGIPGGIYNLRVESDHYLYTAKLVSNSTATDRPVITNAGSTNFIDKPTVPSETKGKKKLLDTKSIIGMQFNAGDTLKLTGRSGNYRTVLMLFPNQSQTVTFNFVKCIDSDSNNYAVVQIGSQLWMQENLRTTKYRDGSGIPNEPDSASWGSLTTGAYCDYHNLHEEGEFYGHLYNYYAVADNRNMCPIGWHVPSHAEWNVMEKFLDNTVDTTALMGTGSLIGRILKEGCDTRWQYLDSTSGLNSAGFTALCTNYRIAGGAWSQAPDNNHDDCFWTSTSYNNSSAWFRSLRWCTSDIYVLFPRKNSGYSVRCVKDE